MCGGGAALNQNETITIVWLDDEIDHKKDAENLSLRRETLEVIFLTPGEFEDFIKGVVTSERDVDLYLIDDRLFKEKQAHLKPRGFTYAAIIREKFPETPIYFFSAVRDLSGIFLGLAEAARNLADCIVDLKDVLRHGSDFLYYDALDYRRIKEAKRNNLEAIHKLLRAPKSDWQKIEQTLPDDLRGGISRTKDQTKNASGNVIAFAKWVRRTLLSLPGFLYDSLYAATKLGLTEDFFLDNVSVFDGAQYNGIFSHSMSNRLWWNSELDRIVFDIAEEELCDESSTDVREILRSYFKLREKDLPICAVCKNPHPDTVGINKYDPTERRPVHFRCSRPHPKKIRVLYFDEIREFEPGDD